MIPRPSKTQGVPPNRRSMTNETPSHPTGCNFIPVNIGCDSASFPAESSWLIHFIGHAFLNSIPLLDQGWYPDVGERIREGECHAVISFSGGRAAGGRGDANLCSKPGA